MWLVLVLFLIQTCVCSLQFSCASLHPRKDDTVTGSDNQCHLNSTTQSKFIFNNEYTEIFKETAQSNVFELYEQFPLFLDFNSSLVGKQCKKSMEKVIEKVKRNDVEALKILDASAKIPSGLLRGNLNQYGDFDECFSVPSAHYCLAEIDLRPIWKKPFLQFKELLHSYFPIKEEFDDPKHRVPGFNMVRWGFCLPKECTHADLKNHLEEKYSVRASVDSNMCQSGSTLRLRSPGYYIARSLLLMILLLVFTSTSLVFYEKWWLFNSNSKWAKSLLAFSIQLNWKKFTRKAKVEGDEIRAVHGVRGCSALALLMSHKAMALFYNPYINRTEMIEHYGLPWSVIGRTAIIYTDSFIFISGLLTSKALLTDLINGNGMKFKEKLITRIFRITPTLVAVILFCTYVLPDFGSGPLWPIVVEHHSNLCKKYMWRNMLYIHNYFGFETMCLTHTHQVGIDMQLFLVTPIFVYILWITRKLGLWIIGFLATSSTILRFWISWQNNLSHLVYFGIPVSRMFDTANMSYILPTHRATVYLMGVTLAYILKTSRNPVYYSKFQVSIYWLFFLIIGFLPMMGPFHMATKGYVYNILDGATYGTFSPIFWGMGVWWVIYASNNNYGGWFGDFLSWRGFELFTRISYAVYLVQFPVFFYNVGVTRHVGEFKPRMLIEIPETLMILGVSLILTLFVDMPFQNLRKVLLEGDSLNRKSQAHHKNRTTVDKRRG